LNAGGTPGNVGGIGALPSAIRLICRESFERRVVILEQIADGEPIQKIEILGAGGKPVEAKVSASPADRIRAIDTLGKYGGIEKLTIDAPRTGDGLASVSDEEMLRVLYARAERLKAMRARADALKSHGVNLEALSA
jgi:hypothetical protein